MADVTTTYLGLTIPEEFGSDDTWGGKLNTAWESVDALFADTVANGGHAHTGASGDGPPIPPGALAGFSGPGLPAYADADGFVARTITAGAGVAVADGDGESGNPTIAVDVSNATELAEGPALDDMVLIHDESAGALRKVSIPNLLLSAKPASTVENAIARFTDENGTLGYAAQAGGPVMDNAGETDWKNNTFRGGIFGGGGVKRQAITAGGQTQLNLADYNVFELTRNTALSELTLQDSPTPNISGAWFFMLIIHNGGGFANINWPDGTRWPGGVEPVLTLSGTDIIVFTSVTNGVTWYATLVGSDYQ